MVAHVSSGDAATAAQYNDLLDLTRCYFIANPSTFANGGGAGVFAGADTFSLVLPVGTWLVSAHLTIQLPSANTAIQARLRDTTNGVNLAVTHILDSGAASPIYHNVFLSGVITVTSGTARVRPEAAPAAATSLNINFNTPTSGSLTGAAALASTLSARAIWLQP